MINRRTLDRVVFGSWSGTTTLIFITATSDLNRIGCGGSRMRLQADMGA